MDNFDLKKYLAENKLLESTEYALSKDPESMVGKFKSSSPQDDEDMMRDYQRDEDMISIARDAFLAAGGTQEEFNKWWKETQLGNIPLGEKIEINESSSQQIEYVKEIEHLVNLLKERYKKYGELGQIDRIVQELEKWVNKLK